MKSHYNKQWLWCWCMLGVALIITGCSSGADPSAPRVVSAISISNTEVVVQFSKAVVGGIGGAEDPASYSIVAESQETHLPVLTAAFYNRHSATVLLTTASQSSLGYKLTVSNIRDEFGTPMADPDIILDDPSSTTFFGTDPSGLAILDSDGDGLSDHVELLGWSVVVKRTNGETDIRTVTSDPNEPDTDLDGVTDDEELHGSMDPRNADTDGDKLSDNDEWNTIFSDPTAMDTDGDGVQDGFEYLTFRTSPILADTDGDQISDPDEVAAGNRNPLISDLPSPRITVGNVNLQLDTRFTYTNEVGEIKTDNKTVETTLSRGESDTSSTSNENSTKSTLEFSQEIQTGIEAGGIDLPIFGPSYSLQATAGSTQGSERGSTFTAGQESSRSSEEAFHESLTTSVERDIRETVTREIVGASIKAFLSIDNVGDVPFTISNLELTAQSQDPNNRRRIIPVASLVPENDSLGEVNIGALGDPSRGPFVFATKPTSVFPQQVEELMKNPRGLLVQLANFDITDEQARNFSFTSQEVLDRTAGITFDLGDGRYESYRVATAGKHDPVTGRPLGITMEYALSIIGLQRYETIRDGGNGVVETTATGDDEQSVLSGHPIEPGEVIVSVGENGVFDSTPGGDDVLTLPDYQTELKNDLKTIRDGGNSLVDTTAINDDIQIVAVGSPVSIGQVIITAGSNEVLDTIPQLDDVVVAPLAPHRVLTRFRDVELQPEDKRFWVLFTTKQALAVDLDKYVLRAGDEFNFSFVQDKDDDGVWASEESLHGSSDLLLNTDACTGFIEDRVVGDNCDFLNDKQEIQEGWKIKLAGSPEFRVVYPNPNQGDSDRDRLFDDQEKACQLDPRLRDTDLDGLTDWEELHGLRFASGEINPSPMVSRDPATSAVIYTITPYGVVPEFDSIHDGGDEIADTTAIGDDVQIVAVGDPVLAGQVIITAGSNEILDTTPNGDDNVISAGQTPHEVISACTDAIQVVGFATNPLNKDTDGDLVDDGLELQLGLNPNDSTDGPLFLDDDGDGVPNKLELDGYEITVNTVNGVAKKYRVTSNPNNPDSDGDGLPDLLEHRLKSNPSPGIVDTCSFPNPLCSESGIDTDGDGIGDFDEYASAGQACITETPGVLCKKFDTFINNGWRDFLVQCEAADVCNPTTIDAVVATSQQYGTNLNEKDSDFDGLLDKEEIDGWDISYNDVVDERVTSLPLKYNSDTDAWSDRKEFDEKTNPTKPDTDGDLTNDDVELAFSVPRRNPKQQDRRITLNYTSIQWTSANCDNNSSEEWDWTLGYQTPATFGAAGQTSQPAWINSDADDSRDTNAGDTENINGNPITFIANYGQQFSLKGTMSEDDPGADDEDDFPVKWDNQQTVDANLAFGTQTIKVVDGVAVCVGTTTVTGTVNVE